MFTMHTDSSPATDPSLCWRIGAAAIDITPTQSVFLFGYPHVPRMSTGVHDPLLATACWVEYEETACLFVGCDLIWLSKALTTRIREKLAAELGLPVQAIMLSATHTHSGPVTTRMLSNSADPTVPAPDTAYLQQVENAILDAARQANKHARPAQLSLACINSSGLGGNRHDPAGPAIESWPIFYATEPDTDKPFAIMCICPMHPTVLHADSTVISGDFPGLARQALQDAFGSGCQYLHHMGASGDQSPRHVTREKTMREAKRLGDIMAQRMMDSFSTARPLFPEQIRAKTAFLDLPLRKLPSEEESRLACKRARARLDHLQAMGADPIAVRSAKVDWFGAEETCTLATAYLEGKLADTATSCLPAELQVIMLGDQVLVGWPGEIFIEFALDVMNKYPNTHVATLANGELQGYLVTQAAIDEQTYEAGNAIFASPESGQRFATITGDLITQLDQSTA